MNLDFGKWAFDNTKLVSFIIAVLMVGGIYAYYDMSKLEDPELKVRQALVVGVYPGASAHQVELEMVDPLEKSIRQTPDVHSVQSMCYADMAIMTVELASTVPNEELEQHWDIMRRKVDAARTSLPSGVSAVQVKDDFGDVFGMFYALTGDGLSDRGLSDYAEYMKREISLIEGISRVDIYGKRSECIDVNLHQDKLAHLGVLPVEVIQTLNGQNAAVYAGYYINGQQRVRVQVSDKAMTIDEIKNLIIQGHEADQLRLCDLAEVRESYDEPVRNSMQYNGERALGLSISATSGTDITKVGKAVQQRMAQLEKQLPAGVECHKIFYQPERVNSALNTFILNLLESVLLVVLVLVFCMGLRPALIIGFSLVVIVLGSVLVLYGLDGTLQRVSLASFILAMGMLVDNAIVIVDGILVDKKNGLPDYLCLTNIGRKTAMPLLGATLIAILAFLPIFMSPDTTGLYVRDLFIVMSVSLLLSWILALVHVPIMANRLLFGRTESMMRLMRQKRLERKIKAGHHPLSQLNNQKREVKGQEEYTGRWYQLLGNVLNASLNHPLTAIVTIVVLVVVAGLCYPLLPQAFFPDMEYDQLYMEYKLPEGCNYTRVRNDLDSIQSYLRHNHPEVTNIVASTGGTPSRYNLVRSIATPSIAYGELIMDFDSPKSLVKHMDAIQGELEELFPDAYVKLKRYNLMYKKYPIEAQFTGPDPAVLHQLSDSCRAIMERSGAVRLITTDWEPKVPTMVVDYNQTNARRLGLSRNDVGLSVMSATDGLPVGEFYDGIHPKKIYINCVDKDGNQMASLDEVSVFGVMPSIIGIANEERIKRIMAGDIDSEELLHDLLRTDPLRQVTNGVDIKWEDPVVIRFNGQRAQRVQCTPVTGKGTEEARQIVEKQLAAQLQLPEGYRMDWIGEKAASDQSMKYLFKNYPLAIILMIAVLIMLFKDYKVPVLLFCCIPMILVGVIPAVLISGKTFGFVAIVGVLGLVGMMIKNGIVLMDEINLQISSGKAKRQALVDASLSRLRPVTMASLTTVLGMIPLLPDAMFGSMAATIMGGLIAGTVTVLVFIPVLYSLFYKVKE